MMKRLLIIVLVLVSVNAFSQISPLQVQAKRGVFTERLYVKDRWLNRITTDMNTSDSLRDDVLPTGKAVADFLRPKAGGYIQNQFTTAQPANLFIQGQATIGSHSDYISTLFSGLPAEVNITHGANQHGLSVQRSSNDGGAAGIVLFKNAGTDFNTLNGLQPGDKIGSISFSGVAGNNTDVVNVMDVHGLVEKTAPDYLSSGLVFNTTDNSGAYGQRVWLNADGNLLLGNATTNPYKLNVETGQVRFNSLAGSGEVLVGADINGKLVKLNLNEYLSVDNGVLNTSVPMTVFYEKYTAILSQAGTNAPTEFVHERGFGGIEWTRNSVGNYTGTLTRPISNKRVLHAEASDALGNVFITQLYVTSPTTVNLITKDAALNNIDGWQEISIQIKSY